MSNEWFTPGTYTYTDYDDLKDAIIDYADIPEADYSLIDYLIKGTWYRFESFCGRHIRPTDGEEEIVLCHSPSQLYLSEPPREIVNIKRRGESMDITDVVSMECRLFSKTSDLFIAGEYYDVVYNAGFEIPPEDIVRLLVSYTARKYSERNLAKEGIDAIDNDSVGDITSSYKEPELSQDEKELLGKYRSPRI